jgi:hypothetical protein
MTTTHITDEVFSIHRFMNKEVNPKICSLLDTLYEADWGDEEMDRVYRLIEDIYDRVCIDVSKMLNEASVLSDIISKR